MSNIKTVKDLIQSTCPYLMGFLSAQDDRIKKAILEELELFSAKIITITAGQVAAETMAMQIADKEDTLNGAKGTAEEPGNDSNS